MPPPPRPAISRNRVRRFGGWWRIPRLVRAGQRRQRQEGGWKGGASGIANGVRRGLLHDDTRDTGGGLKLFRRALFLDLPYFDHMHRFLPALVLREGGVVRSV